MTLLGRNIYANFVGKLWTTGLALALIPVYIRFVGMEGYGLIGSYVGLQAILLLLDLGLGPTLNKEIAVRSMRSDQNQESRDLVRTFEVLYWTGAAFIAISIFALAPFLAKKWFNPEALSVDSLQVAVQIIGLTIALQFPFALYSSGLLGLQRQVLLNGFNITIATVRAFGSILILWLVSSTLEAFFIWQAVMNIAQTLLGGYLLWHSIPATSHRPRFRTDILVGVWRFAAGIAGTGILSAVLIYLTPLTLSKLLTLEAVGYYSLAWNLTSCLFALMIPLNNAFFPRFSQLASAQDEPGLRTLYHAGCQLMSLVLLPVAAVLGLFAYEILLVLQDFTAKATLAENAHWLVSLLVFGNALLCLMSLPGALAQASGWASFAFYMNLVAVALDGPLVFWATQESGAIGAAWVWIALNTGYVLIGMPILHRRLLPGAQYRWYLQDVARPLAATLLVAGCARLLLVAPLPRVLMVMYLICVWLVTFAITMWFTPLTNHWLRAHLARSFRGKLP